MRHSSQRDLVYKLVCDSLKHPTAHEVFEACRKEMPKISLGTVYRNLKDLCELGKIKAIKADDSAEVRYDAFLQAHSHFICRYCGKIIDLEALPLTPSLLDGHLVEETSTVYYGKCSDCANH